MSDENGWAQLCVIGTNIAKQLPEFDPRTNPAISP
jgi:hypothetical protein